MSGKVDNPMNNHIDNLHTLWYDFKFSKYFKHIIYWYGVRFKNNTFSSMSIGNSYNGEMNILNSNFVNLKLKSSLIFTVYTNITINNVTADTISQYPNFVIRLFDIHTFSNLMMTNSNIQNMGVQTIYSEISSFTVNEVNIYNSSCPRSTIETTSSTGIVLKNVNISESIATNMVAFMTFTSSVIDEISNSNFTEIQCIIILKKISILKLN